MFTLIDDDKLDNVLSTINLILTDKEQQVLKLFTEGYLHTEIADILKSPLLTLAKLKKSL